MFIFNVKISVIQSLKETPARTGQRKVKKQQGSSIYMTRNVFVMFDVINQLKEI